MREYMNKFNGIGDFHLNSTNRHIIKMSDILEELIVEKNGEKIIKKISNKIDKNVTLNSLFGLYDVKEDIDSGYAFPGWVKYFREHLPKEIVDSKFSTMDMAKLSFYASENEEQRKELQDWVKLIYQWAFKNKKDELTKVAKTIKADYENKINKGMSEEEIYDFYFTHKKSTVFVSTIWLLLFLGVFLSRVLYLLK